MSYLSQTDINKIEPFCGYKGEAIHSRNMTVAYWDIEAGAPFPEHSHPHEQITVMIEGELEITINGETKILKPGSMTIIPPSTTHYGRALTKCKVVDVFYPVREDYKSQQ